MFTLMQLTKFFSLNQVKVLLILFLFKTNNCAEKNQITCIEMVYKSIIHSSASNMSFCD